MARTHGSGSHHHAEAAPTRTDCQRTDARWLGEDASDREKLAWLTGWLVGREGGDDAGYVLGFDQGYATALRDRAAAAAARTRDAAEDDAVHRAAVRTIVRFVEVAERRGAHDRGEAAA